MAFDFATPVERRVPEGHYASQKWHRYAADVLPLWVADMDFHSPPAVIDALQKRVAHGVYGYGEVPASLTNALCQWSARRMAAVAAGRGAGTALCCHGADPAR